MKRTIAFLLCLLMLCTVFPGLTVSASAPSAASIGVNTAKRHEICNNLSDAAKAYYPAGSTYSDLIALPGIKTDSSVEAIGSPLFLKLQSMMQPKDTISYSALTSYWKYTDAAEGSSDACLFYSDQISSSYNREHVWPKSRGNFYQSGAGSDIQHLRPTDATINSTRSSFTMGNVKNKQGWTVKTKAYNGNTVLWYISNYTDNDCQGLVEVADNVKGDVARIYLYVYVTYGSDNSNKNLFTKCGSYGASDNDGNKVIESLDTLLEWCAIDPVDEWEMMRNDLCQKVQGNRNVFIDYPELGWYLFGREDRIPGDMPTPSGMAAGMTPSSYTITAQSNNDAWGTVRLNGRIIDADPAEGYYAAGYTVLSGEATVTQNGNRFSVNPKSDCTVQINFAAKATAKVRCISADGTAEELTAYTGEEITLPTGASAVEGWRFVGWTASELDGQVTDRPVYYEPGAAFTPLGDTTLYALYTTVDEGSIGETDTYALLTETPAAIEGSYVLTSENAEYVLLCDDTQPVGQHDAAIELDKTGMTKKNDTLLDVSDSYVLICEHVTGEKYTFRLKGADSPVYLMTTDANGGFSTTADRSNIEAQWTVAVNSNSAIISNAAYTARTIQFNGNQMMFRTYTQGQKPVFLWKGVTGGKVYYATAPVSAAHTHECALAEGAEPGCTEDGCIAHLYCGICGKCFSLEQYNETGELVEIPKDSVVIPALGHEWGEPVYIWAEDNSTVTASHTCKRDESHTESEIAKTTSAVTRPATVDEEGELTYTATFENAAFTTQTKAVATPKLDPADPCADGHDWDEPSYEWSEDLSEVTAKRICKTNAEHAETETVQTRSAVTKEATCTEEGEKTYTAVFENAAFASQTKAVAIEKLAHNYVDGVCTVCGAEDPNYEKPVEFVDLKDNAFYLDAVAWAVENNVTTGVDATHFDPDGTCTRAQVVTFLWRAAGEPEPTGSENPFVDVTGGYYYKAVLWAVENEITAGMDATHFNPEGKCTRGQVVTFLWRAAGKPELTKARKTSGEDELPIIPVTPISEEPECPFTDVNAKAYYYEAMLWAVENGITKGTSATTFAPIDTCTRGQVVTFLYRAEPAAD